MKKAFFQITQDYSLRPVSEQDREEVKAYRVNQIIECKLKGTKKARSVIQNAWIHAIFKKVAENSPDEDWNTPDKVKRNVKLEMKFFRDSVIVQGNKVYFELRSFAFHEMEQNEANLRYEQAKLICASHLGVDPSVLEAEATSNL